MYGTTNKAGFSVLEIIIVIVLIGLVGAVLFVPRYDSIAPSYRHKQFMEQLNGLMQFGIRSALSSGTLHRVFFDLKTDTISVQKKASKGVVVGMESHKNFDTVGTRYNGGVLTIPKGYEIENFFIEGSSDEMAAGRQTNDVWFFIAPDGMTQSVIINIGDQSDPQRPDQQFGLELNPYYGIFVFHDTPLQL